VINIKNNYIIEGDIVKIILDSKYGKFYALIDLEDFEKANNCENKWCLRSLKHQYAQQMKVIGKVENISKYTTIKLHNIIMDCPEGMRVDHINHNTLDNRKQNLRIVEYSKNSSNRSGANINNKTGVRNVNLVTKYKGKQVYMVQIMKNGEKYSWEFELHQFDEACRFAEQKRKELFGDYAGNGIKQVINI